MRSVGTVEVLHCSTIDGILTNAALYLGTSDMLYRNLIEGKITNLLRVSSEAVIG
jgi:hypothetical protein